jgi:hypothetical protein
MQKLIPVIALVFSILACGSNVDDSAVGGSLSNPAPIWTSIDVGGTIYTMQYANTNAGMGQNPGDGMRYVLVAVGIECRRTDSSCQTYSALWQLSVNSGTLYPEESLFAPAAFANPLTELEIAAGGEGGGNLLFIAPADATQLIVVYSDEAYFDLGE